MSPRAKAVVLLWLLLLPCACVDLKQPATQLDYYALDYPPPAIENLDPLPVILRVGRFGCAPPYDGSAIVYSRTPYHKNSYVYHKWRSAPADLLAYLIYRDLRESGLFKAVEPMGGDLPAGYSVDGMVDAFYEDDAKPVWQAVLAVSLTLSHTNTSGRTAQVVFQKSYHAREACAAKHPEALAAAMSKAMARISGTMLLDIHDALD